MGTYHSTRARNNNKTARVAIRQGLASDGGLFVSDDLGLTNIDVNTIAAKSYHELAHEIMAMLLPDFTADEIAQCVDEAYGSSFAHTEITPLVALPCAPDSSTDVPSFVLELFHGPTSAFKDVALQMLPRLMARTGAAAENKTNNGTVGTTATSSELDTEAEAVDEAVAAAKATDERVLIVTATSGDTGKAALAGFADAPGVGIVVFYPEGKVSRVQELQMTTQTGSNVTVCAVRGNFDDAQTAVKHIFANAELKERLAAQNVVLSSANSINVGRLVPQVVYYFSAYAQLIRQGSIMPGELVEFCVPTGNFGDILAGYYAQCLGLPVAKLLVASDKNNVLFDFLETGVYNRLRPFYTTSSPSMDILVSSNLERMLYYFAQGNTELVSSFMDKLANQGSYTIPADMLARIRTVFDGSWANEEQVNAAIQSCWERNHYLIDPHTACGYHVLGEIAPTPNTAARVLLSTASPYKFPRVVADALGLETPADDFDCMSALEAATNTQAPAQLATLREQRVLHTSVADIDELPRVVEQAATMLT
ncbi:threonine synthase [Collinsella sp. zg1085]|uniref:threonine synthase n=1 Tax=Collinsella sp. zg1085 TaxID=2844380 RepID=UPI001C0B0E32|nr:threonine synthase [Collinsella sp. zg1085]QWT17832.1 threonine synthase [Collinsella sp. zg1085]